MFGIGKTRSRYKVVEHRNGTFDLINVYQVKTLFRWKTEHEHVVNQNFRLKSMEEVVETVRSFREMQRDNEIVREVILDE